LFDADRRTFESNFPVDKMGTGYATLWNAFKRITAGCSQVEKLALHNGTAKRLYISTEAGGMPNRITPGWRSLTSWTR
jgi:predicted TIM-barrel fold metal-dependent hydrolase